MIVKKFSIFKNGEDTHCRWSKLHDVLEAKDKMQAEDEDKGAVYTVEEVEENILDEIETEEVLKALNKLFG